MGKLALPVVKGQKIMDRSRWYLVIPLYDLRECPDCCAIVCGDDGQAGHVEYHEEIDGGEPEAEAEGYVIGSSGRVNGPDYHVEAG